ncbi:hypothetical protein F511_16484 [Dorcoceras hygrometricum]|uniref:Uncharacterized protein n=1 Tax=Dorcoceras hygrometricum TaxID=472368 RepID=A0A2Z7D481_9LAMI|nr:hypothetical protein F511_16484 [Dorcoceras hygrometricum]
MPTRRVRDQQDDDAPPHPPHPEMTPYERASIDMLAGITRSNRDYRSERFRMNMRDEFQWKRQLQQPSRGQSSQKLAKRPFQGLLRVQLLRGHSNTGHRAIRDRSSREPVPLDLEDTDLQGVP